jgi:hypothetical protein
VKENTEEGEVMATNRTKKTIFNTDDMHRRFRGRKETNKKPVGTATVSKQKYDEARKKKKRAADSQQAESEI